MTEVSASMRDELQRCIVTLREELFQSVLPFWYEHSYDERLGGFYSCLTNDGKPYDHRKFMWLNGRQIWMFSKICQQFSAEDISRLSASRLDRAKMIEMAKRSCEFALSHAVREDQQVFFSLTEDGMPHTFQRKIFAACFLCLGCSGVFAVTKEERFRDSCVRMLESIFDLVENPSKLQRPQCAGAPAISPLNVPMILLNLIDEIRSAGIPITERMLAMEAYSVKEILKHVHEDKQMVFENVGLTGEILEGYDGRHLNPGHAIEAGWFLLQYAKANDRSDLKELSYKMVNWSFDMGWDKEVPNGGILYFLDSEGFCPPYLEWDMKLWWPHNEAMIAFAMLFAETGEASYWDKFRLVLQYSLDHFSDAKQHGEWYGYLNRQGQKTHSFKGGPYKGCFHVPRSLLFSLNILQEVLAKSSA
eukprot:gene28321-34196_t